MIQEQLDRGIKAEKLLNDPVLQEAFKSVSDAIHLQWEQSPIRDLEGQQSLRLMLKLLGEVKSVLELAVTDGKLAAEELKRLQKDVITPKQWMNR